MTAGKLCELFHKVSVRAIDYDKQLVLRVRRHRVPNSTRPTSRSPAEPFPSGNRRQGLFLYGPPAGAPSPASGKGGAGEGMGSTVVSGLPGDARAVVEGIRLADRDHSSFEPDPSIRFEPVDREGQGFPRRPHAVGTVVKILIARAPQ